jgi:hypothetical protein
MDSDNTNLEELICIMIENLKKVTSLEDFEAFK